MNRLIDIIAHGCRWLAIAAIISAAIPLYFVARLRIDNSIEVWLESGSSEYRTYRDFLSRYESEEFIVVAADMNDPFSDKAVAVQQDLAKELETIKGVARVLDLPAVCSVMWKDRRRWEDNAKNNRFLTNLLLGEDGRTIGVIAWLEQFGNPAQRRQTVEAIEKAVDKFKGPEFKPHLAGTPLMNVELDRGSRRASALFLPVALCISVLVLAFMLRSISGVIAPMCGVGVTTVWTVGIMAMTGRTMNMVTVVLPSLLFILSLSNGIHITSRFFAIYGETSSRNETVRKVLRELIRPIFLSSITTSVGFASLMISDMKPVADFGLFASIGMLLSFFFNILVVPGALSILHARVIHLRDSTGTHWSSRTGVIMANNRWLVCIVSSALLAGCVLASTKSTVESNVLNFFPDNSRIRRDYAFVGHKLTGFYTVELEAVTDKTNEPAALMATQRLAQAISKRKEVSRVIYSGDILELFNSADMMTPETFEMNAPAELFEGILGKYRIEYGNMVALRMSILISAMASSDFYELLDFIRAEADKTLGPQVKHVITGVVPLLNDVQKSLVDTQVRSFSVAATIILVMIAVFMRSVRAAIAAVLPNLLPVFAIFAFMVLFKIPLDAATVMIASVAIGIAADDTIHFLSHYRREREAGLGTAEGITAAFGKAGRAIVYTSVVTAGGFTILCLASFKPIAYFGILTAVTMLTALAGDLFVLPACVRIFKLWDR